MFVKFRYYEKATKKFKKVIVPYFELTKKGQTKLGDFFFKFFGLLTMSLHGNTNPKRLGNLKVISR